MPSYPHKIASKLPRVVTTIFTTTSALAAQHNAINFAQGFPDYGPEKDLLDLVQQQYDSNVHQYAPMQGSLQLRQVIANQLEAMYGTPYDAMSEITITAGATQAIFTAIAALVGPGDEVIVFSPAYDCYAPAIELVGGKVVYSRLTYPMYQIDWEEVERLITDKTKMIIINTPHNPTGSVMGSDDLKRLEKATQNTGIVVLSDEVYGQLVFDGLRHESVCRYPGLADRSMVVASFGKNFHATGWKIGYVAGPRNLLMEFNKVHQYNVFAVNHPLQVAIATFISLRGDFGYLSSFYQQKRDLFRGLMASSRFDLLPSVGSYFQLASYKAISDEKDTDFCIRLIKEHGIAAIPVSVFYPDGYDAKVVRFCFAKEESTLRGAAEILQKL